METIKINLDRQEIEMILDLIMNQFRGKPRTDEKANEYRGLYGSIMAEIENA